MTLRIIWITQTVKSMTAKLAYQQLAAILFNQPNGTDEAFILLENYLGVSRSDVLLNSKHISESDFDRVQQTAKKRAAGYPLQYLLEEWEFYGIRLSVGEGVLIPRADTEVLVDIVLESASELRRPRIIDLCSGSGCIAIAVKSRLPNADVFALEKSAQALEYLKRNVNQTGTDITILHDDALAPKTDLDMLDIIVSNPPYLTREDMSLLQTEVAYEPEMALYGLADDGLHFYREITKAWTPRIKHGGVLAYEIGQGQQNSVGEILYSYGYIDICNSKDLCGIIRVIKGIRS